MRSSFVQHTSNIVRKSYYSMSVFFKCFLSNNLSALTTGYLSFVRPILEYSCTVWSPTLHHRSLLACLTSIDRLESVQRFFTRKLFRRCKLLDICYTDRLKFLKLEPLELRRLKLGLTMVFKILNGLVSVDLKYLFELHPRTSRGHSFKLKYPRFSRDARQNCFVVSIVPIWNGLPNSVVASRNLRCFKRNLSLYNKQLLSYCVFDRNL